MAFMGNAMGEPPIPPPQAPTLGAMLPNSPVPEEKGGGLLRVFYEVFKMLDVISSAAPAQSAAISTCKDHLMDVMTSISDGGAGGKQGGGKTTISEPPTSY